LEENVEKLNPLSQELLGRVSKAAGYAMLSELYLNAEVWTGTPMWDKAIEVSDKIINGMGGSLTGTMKLDPDPLGTFNNTNNKSPENIMQFAFTNLSAFPFPCCLFYFRYVNM